MKLVIGNLKMYKELDEVKNYIDFIKGKIRTDLKVVICPPFIYLNLFKSNDYSLGAQNCFYEKEGSYTGEISPFQLKSIGVEFIIVGHSERRKLFNETDEIISKKIDQIMKNNLQCILCIGEDETEKQMHKTSIVIKRQLLNALENVDGDMIRDIIIAYEPIYAIGTGNVPENSDIEEAIHYIRSIILEKYNFDGIKVIYGGSINEQNIENIINIKGIDGVLIGGASLKPEGFLNIINEIN
ncbi:MAG: triose-phosphate isomerase [Bacilli bacterium]